MGGYPSVVPGGATWWTHGIDLSERQGMALACTRSRVRQVDTHATTHNISHQSLVIVGLGSPTDNTHCNFHTAWHPVDK